MNEELRQPGGARVPAAITVALLCVVVLLATRFGAGAKGQVPENPPVADTPRAKAEGDERDTAAIKSQIAKYLRSVDGADTKLAAEVWADSPDVSFIHPLGHERGWRQVKENFFEKLMGGAFSERKLKVVGDISAHVYGDAAWAEFYWDFVAKFKRNGAPLHTKGRETQVYRKDAGVWRLVHAHYSAMPVGGERGGF